PPGFALVRPQRGMRSALRLPRLEVRRHRAMRRPALGGCAHVGARAYAPEELSVPRARRRDLDLHGPAGAETGGTRIRVGTGVPGAALRLQAAAGVQLPAGD